MPESAVPLRAIAKAQAIPAVSTKKAARSPTSTGICAVLRGR